MTGHVFHPGHQALHGITVVVETLGDRTLVGRYDVEDERGVHLLNVGVYEPGTSSASKHDYIRKCARFGVPNDQKHVVVPASEIARITRLGEVS
jgi:hypothetical protein